MNILYPLYHAYFDEGSIKKIQDITKGNLWGADFSLWVAACIFKLIANTV